MTESERWLVEIQAAARREAAALADPVAALVRELRARGVEVDYWHSGGGIMLARVLAYDDASMATSEDDAVEEWLFGLDDVWSWSCNALEVIEGPTDQVTVHHLTGHGDWPECGDETPVSLVADLVEDQLRVGALVASAGAVLFPVDWS